MSQLVQPSQFTILGDYYKISIYSQVAPCVISVAGRLRSPEGEFNNFDHRIDITATGLQTVYRPASGAWWIMSLVASVVSGTVNPGDVLVKVELTQGVAPGNVPHQVLLFGSPDSFLPLTMGSPGEFSADGRRPRNLTIAAADPAADTPYVWTVPAGVTWVVQLISYSIVTAAITGNARPYLSYYQQDSDTLWEAYGSSLIGAGATAYVEAAVNLSYYETAVPSYNFAIPDGLVLNAGDTIYASFANGVTAPQVRFPVIKVAEMILGF